MSATLHKTLFVLPVSLIFSISAWAQTAAFEGTVTGPDGKIVVGAVMKIERQDVKGNYTVKTDKRGHYFYGGLPLGNYKISAVVENVVRDFRTGRTTVGETQVVDFHLPPEGAPAAAEDETKRALTPAEKAEIEKKDKAAKEAMAKNKELNDAFNAGMAAKSANNWDAAIEAFGKAGEVDANQHVVWGNLAESYVNRAKTKTGAEQAADYQKAGEAYQKAIAIKADDAGYHNNYGINVLAATKKYDEAQAELNKAAQLDPTNAGKYYYNLGAVYTNTGNMEPAAAAFKKAIESDPNYADAYYQYGVSLLGKASTDTSGKIIAPPGTTEALQKYLDLKPDGPFAQPAKDLMASLGAKVDTNFSKGNQKKK
ncbi:MAG TPA: tetratricopeptide repeat protein [Bryobacteraceae bacterium]|nr:tetratricopeptide repeat protein [Bryobacteraceae bacterium]